MKEYYSTLTQTQICIIENTQSNKLFCAAQKAEIDSSITWYVMEGYFFFDRGLKIILQALALVAAKGIGLIVVGNIPNAEKTWMDEFAERHNLASNIITTGHLDYLEVPQWISAAHAGLSITLAENARTGCPNKLYNYLTLGKPVISDSSSGTATFVRETGAGVCLQTNEPEELAQVFLKLKDDKNFYASLLENVEKAYQLNNWDNTSKTLIEAINGILLR